MLLPAVPGLREIDDVEGQDENTTEVDTLVAVVEDAEGGLQQPGKPLVSSLPSISFHSRITPTQHSIHKIKYSSKSITHVKV